MRQTVRGWHLQLKCDKAERFIEHVRVSAAWLVELLWSILSDGAEAIVEASERLPGALDAAKVQASGPRGDSCGPGAWPSCQKQAEGVRALGEGVCPRGSMMGAG